MFRTSECRARRGQRAAFTGRYPEELFSAVTIAARWGARALLFSYWMTEEYPPFVWA